MGLNSVLEQQAYKLPGKCSFLSYSSSNLRDLSRKQSLEDISIVAQDVGFTKTTESIPTRDGEWGIFDRKNFGMPNFPEGSTTIHSMLALYNTEEGMSQAVLRISAEPFDDDQFCDGIQKLTQRYIERPMILGFPSKAMTNSSSGVLVSMLFGIGVGALAGYALEGSYLGVAVGAFIGEVTFGTAYGLLNYISEKFSKSELPLNELCVGRAVQGILSSDQTYLSKVPVKKELYQRLLDQGLVKTPEEFIQEVYHKIWPELVQLRVDERKLEEEGIEVKHDALERMVSATRLLPSITPA